MSEGADVTLDTAVLADRPVDAVELIELLTIVADHAARMASYPGAGDAPAYLWAAERTANPRPGDLVVELTHRRWTPDCIGWLVSITEEPMYEPGEWDEQAEGRPSPTDTIWTLRTLLGTEVRWSNCRFAAVPKDLHEMYRWGEDLPAAVAWHEDFARREAERAHR